jgi:hypothetical protein
MHEALLQQQTAATVGIMARSSGHIFASAAATLGHQSGVGDAASAADSTALGSNKPEAAIIPTHESLMAIKHKKKLLTNGTEQFNIKPSKVGMGSKWWYPVLFNLFSVSLLKTLLYCRILTETAVPVLLWFVMKTKKP